MFKRPKPSGYTPATLPLKPSLHHGTYNLMTLVISKNKILTLFYVKKLLYYCDKKIQALIIPCELLM